MKITLTEAQTIKSKDYDSGDEVIVAKDVGERLIEDGIASRVIEETENRVIEKPDNRSQDASAMSTTYHAHRFTGGKKVFRGSDSKDYHAKGDGYVEVKE